MKKTIGFLSVMIVIILVVGISLGAATSPSTKADTLENRLQNALVLYIGSPLAYVDNKETRIDIYNPLVRTYTLNGIVMVPVRFISESLGGKVSINQKNIDISYKGKNIKLALDSDIMMVNNISTKLKSKAQYIEGRTFVPLDALASAMGKKAFSQDKLIVISDKENIFDKTKDKAFIHQVTLRISKPLTVDNEKAFINLLKESRRNFQNDSIYMKEDLSNGATSKKSINSVNTVAQSALDEKNYDQNSKDFSTTNVQVQGVDESDTVKSDGEYIYQVNGNRIVITKAYPAEEMKIESYITFEDSQFIPNEIYADSKSLTVIGTTYKDIQVYNPQDIKKGSLCPPNYGFQTVKTYVYDITDKLHIKKLREFEIEGTYVSSRKIGSIVYLVANKNIYSWVINQSLTNFYLDNKSDASTVKYDSKAMAKYSEYLTLPSYSDSVKGGGFKQMGYKQIQYLHDSVQPNYLLIAAIDTNDSITPASVYSYLGSGQNIYASEQNLYTAVYEYSSNIESNTGNVKEILPQNNSEKTLIYKFSLNGSKVLFSDKGEVPGTILNQYSMDENGDYFRIATTTNQTWGNDVMKNNLYILDKSMSIEGKVEDIAPGEKIYSVRFMGDRGYIVTFRTIDPLFVIDLKQPESPKILGTLKIPGVSDYLQPYDENHIIGFGKDTIESKGNAYYLGMKIALFDVTNVAKPVEMFSEKIGGRGTESEILSNPKALLFSKDKNLLAFPVTVMETSNLTNSDGFPEYGQFSFQGAYVYNFDLKNGFKLKGKITHMTDEEYKKAGSYGYDNGNFVKRVMYINDTLYTLSNGTIMANKLADLKEVKRVEIK